LSNAVALFDFASGATSVINVLN